MTFFQSLAEFARSQQELVRTVPADLTVRYADFFEKFQRHFIGMEHSQP